MLHGEGGTAKTTLQEFIKMLVDPSAILTLSISFDIESMAQKIAHNYVCYFDNISKITDTISDLLCRAITGSGFLKRELFTDDEDVIYELRYCLGLTGINLAATKSDLLDRGLIIEHKPIYKQNIKRLKIIWKKFYEIRPKLLGYIFDILVKVLKFEKEHPEGLKLEEYPRLADFAEVCEIISRCMGNEPMEFMQAFEKNVSLKHRTAIEDSSVGKAIQFFIKDKKDWEGRMTDLLSHLKLIAISELQIESIKNGRFWPQTASVLSRRINEIKADLRAIGIVIERISTDTSDKQISIKNLNFDNNGKNETGKVEEEQQNKKQDSSSNNHEGKNNFSDTPSCVEKLTRMQIEPNADCIISSSSSSTSVTEIKDAIQEEKSQTQAVSNTQSVIDSIGILDNSIIHDPTIEKKLLAKVAQILGVYQAFDFEWKSETNIIEAASFVDSNGNSEVKFRIRDFNGSEIALLRYIMVKLIKYRWSIGWNSQGHPRNAGSIKTSDLSILYQRCKANGINSIVKLGSKGVPYLIGGDELKHIDLLNVYGKIMVQEGMYSNAYRTHKLDEVSKALLGHGKYKNYSGKDFASVSIEEQEKYSLVDSQLVMELSKHNNFEVLDALLAISEITELDFEKVARTNLSTWWGAIFDKMVKNGECKPLVKTSFSGTYKGAEVLAPKKGLYNNIVVVDAKSLYPSVGINYNLSFDTINCSCCSKDDLARCKISALIPSEFTKDCKFVNPDSDWICKRKIGAFPTKLKVFKAERLKQKDLGNKSKQHALKILINGGYGVFGSGDYSYYDPRVAELVTAAGRYTLSKMQYIANHDYGFEIIYGDTDSLFLNNTSEKSLLEFQERFNREYDIELEVKNRYDKLLLSAGKKHYIGYEKGIIDSVGFEGEKSDRCKFFHRVYDQLINDIIKQEIDPIPNVRKAISDLDSENKVNPDLLKISQVVGKDNYNQSSRIGKIAKALGAKKGDTIEYFNANEKKTGKSWTINPTEIDIQHTKQLLWNTIDEVLEISGYPIEQLATEFGCCVIPTTKKGDKAYLQEVSLGDANAKGGGS
jgi:DNA polymerase elongation subunit (family B)